MNDSRKNIAANLRYLRSKQRLTQEAVAERIGVTRQAVAKWENGESLPDIVNCQALAELYDVSLDDLVRHDAEAEGIPIPPKDKHIFGLVTLGERGQVVLPKKARDTFQLKPGDSLLVLGDTSPERSGLALIRSDTFLQMTGFAVEKVFETKGE
ncbi:MAG TPA: helix-turn-helix domain-containing protein [Firmicutes bacterium]|nr:MAG: XRE family transcriptional regulator [Peptococcaceae bacterium 1109]HHT72974.1 helix-turn-helix domain-containing protein [Bacillota bacterium]